MMIIEPVKTEKAIMMIDNNNSLTFEVKLGATRNQISEEVERLFNVKVHSVKTHITPAGKKRAVVRLSKEHKADEIAAKLKIAA